MKLHETKILIFLLMIAFCLNISTVSATESYEFKAQNKSYEIVFELKTWNEAAEYAKNKGGYLTHIDSEEEQNAIWDAIDEGAKINKTYVVVTDGGGVAYIWIGASDNLQEGVWIWDGDNNGQGKVFWEGISNTGNPVGSSFINWGGKSWGVFKEPDNFNGNQNSAAIALEPWPKNMGMNGISGEWNDIYPGNKLYFIVEYDYSDVPGKCSLPTGVTELCQGAKQSQYKTKMATEASEYEWSLNPTTAGTITWDEITADVNWNSEFSGEATISVKAVNPLGEGESSESLTVNIIPLPEKPDVINGDNALCANSMNYEYFVDIVDGATGYSWALTPEEAGTIEVNSEEENYALLSLSDDFTGELVISVAAENNCGMGTAQELTITVSGVPMVPETPTGNIDLDINAGATEYTVFQVQDADSYKWLLTPEEAGTITGTTNTAIVEWTEDYEGKVAISVAAVNHCGESEFSEILEVTILDKSSVIDAITGNYNIYPNPSDGSIFFDLSTTAFFDIEICDLLGRGVYSAYGVNGFYEVNLIQKGIFFVNILSQNKKFTHILIVK